MKYHYSFLLFLFVIIGNTSYSQEDHQNFEHYFYQNGERVYYPLRPHELYVKVKPIHFESNNLSPQASIIQISALLDSLGLFISYKNYEDTVLLKYEAETINGQSGFSPCVLFVARKDSLPFDLRNSEALKQLRLSPFVSIAGPIVLQENQEQILAFTYGRKISFIPKTATSPKAVNRFLASIELQRVKPNFNSVETPIEDAMGIVDYIELFMESGLFEKVEMDVFYSAYLD